MRTTDKEITSWGCILASDDVYANVHQRLQRADKDSAMYIDGVGILKWRKIP